MSIASSVVGVDVGGTHIRIGAVSPALDVKNTKLEVTTAISGIDAQRRLLDYVEKYIQDTCDDVSAVSIGFPATLDRERTTVVSTPNIEGMDNMNVKQAFEGRLGVPVFIEKDACMLLYNDLRVLDLSHEGIIIGCYFGTGIGNVILVDGEPLTGCDGVAGELSHVPVIGKTDLCSCGLEGCLENYAGGKALEALRRRRFPETPISEVFAYHCQTSELQEFIRNMASAITIEINTLNPHCVVLGGGVLAMADFPRDQLTSWVFKLVRRPVPAESLNIVFADPADKFGGVVGAALYAWDRLDGGSKCTVSEGGS